MLRQLRMSSSLLSKWSMTEYKVQSQNLCGIEFSQLDRRGASTDSISLKSLLIVRMLLKKYSVTSRLNDTLYISNQQKILIKWHFWASQVVQMGKSDKVYLTITISPPILLLKNIAFFNCPIF